MSTGWLTAGYIAGWAIETVGLVLAATSLLGWFVAGAFAFAKLFAGAARQIARQALTEARAVELPDKRNRVRRFFSRSFYFDDRFREIWNEGFESKFDALTSVRIAPDLPEDEQWDEFFKWCAMLNGLGGGSFPTSRDEWDRTRERAQAVSGVGLILVGSTLTMITSLVWLRA